MAREKNWTVRDGDEKDIEGILSLRKLAFGVTEGDKLSPEAWRWEYEENPDGKGLVYIVEDQGRIIGSYASIPRRFSANGEIVLGTHPQDLMVHPDEQGKGVFHAMAEYEIKRSKEEKAFFMAGFPLRVPTYSGLKKIGWKDVTDLPVLVYPVRFSSILNRYLHFQPVSFLLGQLMRLFHLSLYGFRRSRGKEEIEVERISAPDESFDIFWQKASSLYAILGIRDREHLIWRYFQHPTRVYTLYRALQDGEMKGYLVLRKIDLLHFKSGVIVDVLALDEATFSELVRRGIQYSCEEGLDLLGMMVPRGHPYHHYLKKMGFLPSFKTFHFIVYPHSDKKIFLLPESWYVNWGDTDHL